jgi:hypothetical protein
MHTRGALAREAASYVTSCKRAGGGEDRLHRPTCSGSVNGHAMTFAPIGENAPNPDR